MRRVLTVIVSLLVAGAFLPAVSPAASADTIADKRSEAERLARDLAMQGERVAVLAEEYNVARLDAGRVDALVADAEQRLAAAAREADAATSRLRDQAISSYMHSGSAPTLSMLAESQRVDDIALRREYLRSATASTADAIDGLRAARADLEAQRGELEGARDAAHHALADVETRRRAAQSAEESQRRLLARVKGELSTLVAAETRRRAEENARQARADLARRQEREDASRRAAAAAAVTTTTTTTTRTRTTAKPAPGSPSPAPAASGADVAIAEARRQLGKPYQYGASGPDSFDCSGLTSWAWKAAGVTLPHSSRAQWSATKRVAVGDVAPGDLVFYGDPIHHVGLYVGGGEMIEASETGTPVRQTTIFRKDLVGAGRVGS